MTKCLNHPRRRSVSEIQSGVPPLCDECWTKMGLPVKSGDKVISTVAHPANSGVVARIVDDGIAVTKTPNGAESWNPLADLVKRRV